MTLASSPYLGADALNQFRQVRARGELPNLKQIERFSGEMLYPEARKLFAALPAVTPSSSLESLVTAGFLSQAPRRITQAQAVPRYRLGRGLFVKTQVSPRPLTPRGPAHSYQHDGSLGFTHQAELVGQAGDQFAVAVHGAPHPMMFAKTDIFAWNEPWVLPEAGTTLSGVQVDFHEPLWKAHVTQGFLDIAADVANLDFMGPGATELQGRLIQRLVGHCKMSYAGRGHGYAGSRASGLLDGGQGVCFVQRTVLGAYLQLFARLLSFDLQFAWGRSQSLNVPHAFLVVLLRPSMQRFVIDPAWGEPLTELRLAFFGPAWGQDRRLEGFEGEQPPTLITASDVELPTLGAA